MKSSLEIAQEAELRPIESIAEEAGLLPEEFDPYGRYKAKSRWARSTGSRTRPTASSSAWPA